MNRTTFTFLLTLWMLPAAAQSIVGLDIKVNHGYAYRDQSWAVVEVMIDNRVRDIEGQLELKLYDGMDTVLSPVYRTPLDSPLNSRKIYKFHCLLDGAARAEVQVYRGRSPMNDVNALVQLSPLRENDRLCLVLDDKPDYYGFMSTNVFRDEEDIRVHRESLNTPGLDRMADKLSCFETFDLIVLGEIDPQEISERHREHLLNYVRRGGQLVVMLGENAPYFRGSWLEPHLGVEVAGQQPFNEAQLQEAAFGTPGASARTQVESSVSILEPVNEGVRSYGEHVVIATQRAFEAGAIVTIAVDAESGMLQHTPEYARLWRELLTVREQPQLAWQTAFEVSRNALPHMAGVKTAAFSSVAWYLGIYFTVGIVLNWLFWNWMRRRELAWVCLLFVSIGFTVYAIFFGTQGRVRNTEIENVSVMELSPGSTLAQERQMVGLLAAGTNRYGGTAITDDASIADPDLWNRYTERAMPTPFGSVQGHGPFNVVEAEPPAFEDMRIGASEMRFLLLEHYRELSGTVTGEVTLLNGVLQGVINNNTGLSFEAAGVLYNGQMFPLGELDETTLRIWDTTSNTTPLPALLQTGDFRWRFDHSQSGSLPPRVFQQNFGAALGGIYSDPYYGGRMQSFSSTPILIAAVPGEEAMIAMTNDAHQNLRFRFLVVPLSLAGAVGDTPIPIFAKAQSWVGDFTKNLEMLSGGGSLAAVMMGFGAYTDSHQEPSAMQLHNIGSGHEKMRIRIYSATNELGPLPDHRLVNLYQSVPDGSPLEPVAIDTFSRNDLQLRVETYELQVHQSESARTLYVDATKNSPEFGVMFGADAVLVSAEKMREEDLWQ